MIQSKYFILFVIVPTSVFGLLVYLAGGTDAFAEGGVIENLTVVGYAITAVIVLALPGVAWLRRSELAFLIGLLAARELDLHKAFTQDSLLKMDYYLKTDAPLMEKGLSILFLVAIAAVAVHLVVCAGPGFLAALKARRDYTLSVLCGLIFIGFSKSIDGIPRKMRGLGVSVDDTVRLSFRSVEELVELMIPLVFTAACIQFWMLVRSRHNSPQTPNPAIPRDPAGNSN